MARPALDVRCAPRVPFLARRRRARLPRRGRRCADGRGATARLARPVRGRAAVPARRRRAAVRAAAVRRRRLQRRRPRPAEAMAARGAMVAGIAVTPFYQRLQREAASAASPMGRSRTSRAICRPMPSCRPMSRRCWPARRRRHAGLCDAGAGRARHLLRRADARLLSAAAVSAALCRAHALDQSPLAPGPGSELLPKPPLPGPWVTLQRPSDSGCPEERRTAFVVTAAEAGSSRAARPAVRCALDAGARPKAKEGRSRRRRRPTTAPLPAMRTRCRPSPRPMPSSPSAATRSSTPPASLSDLPVVEVPAAGGCLRQALRDPPVG